MIDAPDDQVFIFTLSINDNSKLDNIFPTFDVFMKMSNKTPVVRTVLRSSFLKTVSEIEAAEHHFYSHLSILLNLSIQIANLSFHSKGVKAK